MQLSVHPFPSNTSAFSPVSAQVVIFAVPGAFTPTCSKDHAPGFISSTEQLKAKGVDTIACVSVNDPFVMGAWAKDLQAGELRGVETVYLHALTVLSAVL